MKLSLAMIVANEASMVPGFLESIEGLWDELVVVDTGSSDGTVAAFEAAGAKVVHAAWTHDFSAARNVGLAHVTGEWVLVLDADERVTPEFKAQLRAAIARPELGALEVRFTTPLPYGHRAESSAIRAWRRDDTIRFRHPVREEVDVGARRYELIDAPVVHLGAVRHRAALQDQKRRDAGILRAHLVAQPQDFFCWLKLLELARVHQDETLWREAAREATDCLELAGRSVLTSEAFGGALVALIAEGLFAPDSGAGLMYLESWSPHLQPSTEYRLRRGFFREHQSKREAAREDYEASLSDDPVAPRLGLARLALARSDGAAALQLSRRALEAGPRNPEALLAVASLTRQLEGKAALELWGDAHQQLEPACPERDWAIGEASLASGDHKRAVGCFRRAAGVPPAGPSGVRLAQALLASGQLAASERLAHQLLTAQPEAGLGVLLFDLAAGRDTTLELELTEESANAALRQWVDALVASKERKVLRKVREQVGAVGNLFPWLPEYLLKKTA